jgi:L-ribulokinase
MGKIERAAYTPDPQRAAAYEALYVEYQRLHDYFGRGANEVLHRLRELRIEAHAQSESTEVEA